MTGRQRGLLIGLLICLAAVVGTAIWATSHDSDSQSTRRPGLTSTTLTSTTLTSTTLTSTTSTPYVIATFLTDFTRALQLGDATFLYDRLNPAVIERFGTDPCRASVQLVRDPTASYTLVAVQDTGAYTWTTGNQSTTVPDTITVRVDVVNQGTSTRADLHLTPVDGRLTYFRDCTR